MCRIKTGKQIVLESDLQNLVTATILRSTSPYSIDLLSIEVQNKCQGSDIDISYERIYELVTKTTRDFLRCEYLDSYNGKYFSKLLLTNV